LWHDRFGRRLVGHPWQEELQRATSRTHGIGAVWGRGFSYRELSGIAGRMSGWTGR
jgi:hypothetical protein